ncbi:MAG: efflux RND transporter periplasmic adaptor subunit [Acidobacteria bacterium]|nr:efflux RND transporter periplasmic adaptor subunit [Acidobacteriota bacterium]
MNTFSGWPTVALPVLALGVVLTLGACGSDEPAASEFAPKDGPIAVQTATVVMTDRRSSLRVLGTVRSQQTVVVSSRLPATILAVNARAGEHVQKGRLLIDLDDRELASAVTAAEAARAEAESAMRAADQSIVAARAELDLAKLTHQRFENLLQKESVSQQEYDESAARVRLSDAGLRGAESGKEQVLRKREQAEAGIAAARTRLSYTSITAPVSGLVVERLIDPGSMANPGVPLMKIEPSGRYLLEINVPESHLRELKLGQALPVRIDALGDEEEIEGRVLEIVPVVDPHSRTFVAKLSLLAGSGIQSGLYGYAALRGPARQVLTIPAEAVVEYGQLKSALVVEDGVAKRRLITLGDADANQVAVLSGLTAGDQVILNPSAVKDGALVRASGMPQS